MPTRQPSPQPGQGPSAEQFFAFHLMCSDKLSWRTPEGTAPAMVNKIPDYSKAPFSMHQRILNVPN